MRTASVRSQASSAAEHREAARLINRPSLFSFLEASSIHLLSLFSVSGCLSFFHRFVLLHLHLYTSSCLLVSATAPLCQALPLTPTSSAATSFPGCFPCRGQEWRRRSGRKAPRRHCRHWCSPLAHHQGRTRRFQGHCRCRSADSCVQRSH